MIYVLSTEIGVGKGGISTALLGFQQTKALSAHPVTFVTSHASAQKLRYLLQSYRQMRNVTPGDIVWLHCGDWLSVMRKFLLGATAKLRGAKVVYHFHGQSLDEYLEKVPFKYLVRAVCAHANGIIVLSDWWKRRLASSIDDIDSKIMVLGNPLDQQFSAEAQTSTVNTVDTHAPVRLLAMSRLVTGKGFELAIKALSLLPANYVLTIAGEGPLRADLEELVQQYGLDKRVDFVGWVNYEDKKAVIKRHHLFVLPSSFDSFGMGFIEAMACGVPVVGLDQNATPDVVKAGYSGELAQVASPEHIADAAKRVVAKHKMYALNARVWVLEKFEAEPLAEALMVFLNKL